MHKAGFVNIVGNPNVGKSTLMNLLMGERISIATFKAQTTRHRIMGIINTDDSQIVFSDTPGVLKPNYKLQESMLAFSESALQDADVLLYVTDVVEKPDKNADFITKVQRMQVPILVLINKIDLSNQAGVVKLIEALERSLAAGRNLPHFCASQVRGRQRAGAHQGVAPRFAALLRKRPMDRQACALFRYGDHPRKDTFVLRQGDSLRL